MNTGFENCERKIENHKSNWMKTTGMDIDKKIPTSANLCFTRSSEFYCAVHCKAPHIIGFAIAENKTNTPTIISAGNRSWLMMGLIDKLIEAITNFFGQIAIWNHFSLFRFCIMKILSIQGGERHWRTGWSVSRKWLEMADLVSGTTDSYCKTKYRVENWLIRHKHSFIGKYRVS